MITVLYFFQPSFPQFRGDHSGIKCIIFQNIFSQVFQTYPQSLSDILSHLGKYGLYSSCRRAVATREAAHQTAAQVRVQIIGTAQEILLG